MRRNKEMKKRNQWVAAALALSVVMSGIPAESLSAGKPSDVFKGEEWFDQNDVFEVNREDAHASFTGFDNLESVKSPQKRQQKEKSPYLYWSSFLVTLCSEIMLYIETPLVSYSYSLNEVSHSCTS